MAQKKDKNLNSRTKLWISLACIVLAVILCCTMTHGFADWNPYCWFGHNYDATDVCKRCGADKPVEEPVEAAEPEQANGNVIFQSTMANGLSLYATPAPLADTDAEMSFDLTANVKPLSADDKRIDWTIAWKDSNSLWAIGKDVADYATLTPASQYSQNANVTILQDFGEQIIVTATSIDNPEYFDVGTFDYVQRITGFTFNMPSISSTTTTFTYSIESSNYTIAADVSIEVSDSIILYDDFAVDFYDYIIKLGSTGGAVISNANLVKSDNNLVISANVNALNSASNVSDDEFNHYSAVSGLVGCFVWYDSGRLVPDGLTEGDLIAAFRSCCQYYSPNATFDLTYSATYDGKTYSQGTKTIEVFFDGEALHVPVEGVTLAQKHFVV